MVMNKHDDHVRDAPTRKRSRRARLQALLFTGAAFGTALLTLVAGEPKTPPFRGE
jgi:hypothetical protein